MPSLNSGLKFCWLLWLTLEFLLALQSMEYPENLQIRRRFKNLLQ